MNPLTFTSFGSMLRYLRLYNGLTQCQLGKLVGYSPTQIARLELNQRRPDLYTLRTRIMPTFKIQDNLDLAQYLMSLAQRN